MTSKQRLMPILMDYVPKPEVKKSVWNGGSVEYFERKLKELEEQNPERNANTGKCKNDIPKALKKPKSYKQDMSKQTTIGSFFNASKNSEEESSNTSLENKEPEENGNMDIKLEKIDSPENEDYLDIKPDDDENKTELNHERAASEDNLEILISKEQELKLQIEKLEQEEKEEFKDEKERTIFKENKMINENEDKSFKPSSSSSTSSYGNLFKSKRITHFHKNSKDKYRSHLIYTPPDPDAENDKNYFENDDEEEEDKEKEPDDILSLLDKIENENKKYEERKEKLNEKGSKSNSSKDKISTNPLQYSLSKDKLNPSSNSSSASSSKIKSSSNYHSSSHRSNTSSASISSTFNSMDAKTLNQTDADVKLSSLKQNLFSTSSGLSLISKQKLQKEREAAQKQKNDISKSVVENLNPYYKRKIATKELFKVLAKRITNRIIDGKLGKLERNMYWPQIYFYSNKMLLLQLHQIAKTILKQIFIHWK